MAYTFTQTGAEIQAILDFVQTKMETVLFSGDTTGTVTLSESAANFSELVIYYEGASNRSPQTMTIASPNGRRICLSIVEDSVSNGTRVRRASYDISGTSISLTTATGYSPGYTLLNGTAVSQSLGTNVIHITKVVGRG